MDHCLDCDLVRRVFFSTEHYKLLINNEYVHHFALPYHKRTNIYNRENWTYALEAQGDTPTKHVIPPTPEYHPTPPSDRITIFSSNVNIQRPNIDYDLNAMRQEMASLHEELTDLTLQMEVANATHAEEADYLCQEIHSL